MTSNALGSMETCGRRAGAQSGWMGWTRRLREEGGLGGRAQRRASLGGVEGGRAGRRKRGDLRQDGRSRGERGRGVEAPSTSPQGGPCASSQVQE
eukprot:273642-Chlamydomonas_euryale.AAC.2